MWYLPGPGIKSMSPALAGIFLSTGPPGKSKKKSSFLRHCLHCCIPLPHTQLQNVVPTLALENGTLRGFETDRLHSHSVHPGAPEARCLISASLGSLYIQIITEPAAHQVVGRLHLNNTLKCFMDYLHIVSLIKGQLLI